MRLNKLNSQRIGIIFIILIILGLFSYVQNNLLKVTKFEINSDKLPQKFDGFKIVHLTDLHGKLFGKDQKYLIEKIKNEKPDIIVYTGDLVDKRHYDGAPGLLLMRELKKIAPVYYVTGNHEWWTGKYDELKKLLIEEGVVVVGNTHIELKKIDTSIMLYGLEDPTSNNNGSDDFTFADKKFQEMKIPEDGKYKILLSHRPELFQIYKKHGFDLVFAGHAHGGQIRIPFIGGIFAPDQGFFPKYTLGLYSDGSTNMVVSGGLGNSIIKQRIFDRPEVVIVTLRHQN